METIKITKKKLAEQARIHIYGHGKDRITTVWFDWNSGEYVEDGKTKWFAGAKYMVAIYGGTQKQALERMWIWLTQGMIGYHPYAKHWMAVEDKHRKKVPLSFNWNAWSYGT